MANTRTILALAAIICLQFTLQAQANHIDFIVDGSFFTATSSDNGLVTSIQTGDAGNIIGGEREVSVDVTSGSGFVSGGTLGASAGPGPVGPDATATLVLSNSVSAIGQFMLTYDGVGTAGLGGLDFATSWDSIVVDFVAVQGMGDLTLSVTDTSAASGSLTLPVSSSGDVTFPFADAAFAGVDFGSVDVVKFTMDTVEAASDFSIGAITRETIVPEPGSVSLALLAFAGLALVRRRR